MTSSSGNEIGTKVPSSPVPRRSMLVRKRPHSGPWICRRVERVMREARVFGSPLERLGLWVLLLTELSPLDDYREARRARRHQTRSRLVSAAREEPLP